MTLFNYIKKYLWSHVESDRPSVIAALVAAVCIVLCNSICPLCLKYTIDMLLKKQAHSKIFLISISASYGIVWTLGYLLCRARSIFARKAILRCLNLMTKDLYSALLKSPMPQRTGDRVSLIERLNLTIPDLIDGFLWHLVPMVFEIVVAFIVVVRSTDLSIALVMLSTVLLYLLSLSVTLRKVTKCQEVVNRWQNNFLTKIIDVFSNLDIVKLFNGFRFEEKNISSLLQSREKAMGETNAQIEKIGSFQFIVVGGGLIIITCLLASKAITSKLLVSDMLLVHGYLMQLTMPLAYFGFVIAGLQNGMATFIEISKYVADKNNYLENEGNLSYRFKPAELKFENLSVEQNGKKIINNISLIVPAGKILGIAGLSGAGKTSLLRTITKELPITNGTLYINHQDIQTISPQIISSIVSVVPQDLKIFHGSILSNIIYGQTKEVPNHLLDLVLKATNLSEVIKTLPNGLDTDVGNEENSLSKGQKQRIAIARCLLKDAQIYVFDEPTSALDVKTEKDIMKNILSYLTNKTVIIVTHRPALLQMANGIVFIKNGKIDEVNFDNNRVNDEWLYKKLSSSGVRTLSHRGGAVDLN